MSVQEKVREFHKVYGHPDRLGKVPRVMEDRKALRWALIDEEVNTELADALWVNDIVEVADAIGDAVYVLYGMAIEFGIDLDRVIDEIHDSNMSKLDSDGSVRYSPTGKVLKGPNFREPNIIKALNTVQLRTAA